MAFPAFHWPQGRFLFAVGVLLKWAYFSFLMEFRPASLFMECIRRISQESTPKIGSWIQDGARNIVSTTVSPPCGDSCDQAYPSISVVRLPQKKAPDGHVGRLLNATNPPLMEGHFMIMVIWIPIIFRLCTYTIFYNIYDHILTIICKRI